jgi:CheY-like chemotaxis protein
MVRLVHALGHHVETVATVAEALEHLRAAHVDLLASDIGLPDGTGVDLIRAVRNFSRIPAIALSGFGMEEDVRRCIAAGFNAHLTKPVNIARLEQLIRDVTAPAPLTSAR